MGVGDSGERRGTIRRKPRQRNRIVAKHLRSVRRSTMEMEVTGWLRGDSSVNGFNLGPQPQGIEIHRTRPCHCILALLGV
jgi:hypothetical protein